MNNTVIQSIVRATEILRCFEGADELGVTEISSRIGLHKSTAFNIITTLERCRYLEKNDKSGKYRLGIELFRLGTKVDSDLRKIARPYLETLVAEFKETVNLVVRDSECVIYLEKIESPHSMRISTAVGSRLPVNATAVGKAILSGVPDDEMTDIIGSLTIARFTDNTICDKSILMDSIKEVRDTGYAEDFEELEMGLTCVAAPIFNHTGKAFSAISVSGPTSRMEKEIRTEIGKALVQITRQISGKLGYISK
ncbi:MAG: IclR family transcriptional regulator [Negativicutes bacterium]|nr:IclR family transcriptional regulator [Negativicutes bacterium]MDR3591221.1 IclR family transcriptional regulator [Negativicutes bacterium]